MAAVTAAILVGGKFASERALGETGGDAFTAIYGHMRFIWGSKDAEPIICANTTGGGCTSSATQINFWSMAGDYDEPSLSQPFRMVKNVVHELGHAFYNFLGRPEGMPGGTTRETVLRPNPAGPERWDWQQSKGTEPSEVFADMMIAWTYNAWNTSTDPKNVLAVDNAQNWMNRLAVGTTP